MKTKAKSLLSALLTLNSSLLILNSTAAVPLSWTVETSHAQPATFEAYQGETIDFEAALQAKGKPLEAPLNYSFFWQTNGMGSTYWEVPCPTNYQLPATNLLRATWLPSMDVGARVYNCFIGSPSNIYHAAFQLRLRPSPGALPNALPLPTPVIDFARVRVLNPPWEGGGGGAVQSVNGKTGAVVLDAAAIPYSGDESYGTVTNVEKGLDYAIYTADEAMTEATGRPTYDELNAKADQSYIDGTVIPAIGDAYSLADSAKQKADAIEPIAMDASQKAYAALDQLQSKVDASMISATDPTFSNEVATVAKTVQPTTVRAYDSVRRCWWVLEIVNGVPTWIVED